MPRSVPEWRGRTADTAVPERVLERLWKKCDGHCQGCGVRLIGQPWDADHIIELILWTGEGHGNREMNLQVLGLKCCHRAKTKAAMVEKHRSSRKVRSLTGIKRSRNPMPGSKASPWCKRMDGTVERRKA